jgi:hypothetical protein
VNLIRRGSGELTPLDADFDVLTAIELAGIPGVVRNMSQVSYEPIERPCIAAQTPLARVFFFRRVARVATI